MLGAHNLLVQIFTDFAIIRPSQPQSLLQAPPPQMNGSSLLQQPGMSMCYGKHFVSGAGLAEDFLTTFTQGHSFRVSQMVTVFQTLKVCLL